MSYNPGFKSPRLIPFRLHTPHGVHQLKISESTLGGAIITHVQSKYPRKNKNTAVFIFISYKGNVYPLNREVTAKFLYEQYKD